MTIIIDVPPQAEAGLTLAANRAGQTPQEVATEAMIRLFGSPTPEPTEGFNLYELLKDVIGCVKNEGEKHLAENAEEEYHRALVQRHAEGHI